MAIILAMTMGFGADRVKQLDRQSVSDQFIDNFNSLVGQARTSSYFRNHKYSQIDVLFASWTHGIEITLSWSSLSSFSGFSSPAFVFDRILVWSTDIPSLEVSITPYAISCPIYLGTTQVSGASFTTFISKEAYCYYLDSSLCLLKKVSCQ